MGVENKMKYLDIAKRSIRSKRIDLRQTSKKEYVTIRTHHPQEAASFVSSPPLIVTKSEKKNSFSASESSRQEIPTAIPAASPKREFFPKKKETVKDLWEERDPGTPPEEIFAETEAPVSPVQIFPKKQVKNQKKLVLAIKAVISVLIIFLLIGGTMFGQAFFSGANIFNKEGTSPLDQIKHLVLAGDKILTGEEEGRINVLLLGMGGEGHDGALLTDSVMVLSIKPGTKQMAMISLPRDLWVKSEKFGYSKLNKVNYYGEMDRGKNEGPKYTRDVVQQITGLNIPYYVRIDFSGFQDIVNSLGGVTVDVENGFIDEEYPTDDYGYQTIKFARGPQNMDGEKALQYARSRHGVINDRDPGGLEKNEASDFARSRRQQKLITAIKDKALTTGVLANPQKLNSLFETLGKHITTNAQMWEGVRLFEMARNFKFDEVKISVISNEKYLKVYTTPDGAYTLIPVDGFGEYGKIQELALNIFDQGEETNGSQEIAVPTGTAPSTEANSGEPESTTPTEATATIAVQNGTTVNGIGAKASHELRNSGYVIVTVGNAADQTRQHTVIYDNTSGQKSEQLKGIAAQFEADIINEAAPANKAGVKENADFVLILGLESTR